MSLPTARRTIPTARPWRAALRLGLLASTCGWGISFYFTFTPWTAAVSQLRDMGAGDIRYDPLLDYWLRTASVVFGCIGIGSLLACLRPESFPGFIRLLGPFHLIVGATLIAAAIANHLDRALHPTFVPDITFCFVTGLLLVIPRLHKSAEIQA